MASCELQHDGAVSSLYDRGLVACEGYYQGFCPVGVCGASAGRVGVGVGVASDFASGAAGEGDCLLERRAAYLGSYPDA